MSPSLIEDGAWVSVSYSCHSEGERNGGQKGFYSILGPEV